MSNRLAILKCGNCGKVLLEHAITEGIVKKKCPCCGTMNQAVFGNGHRGNDEPFQRRMSIVKKGTLVPVKKK